MNKFIILSILFSAPVLAVESTDDLPCFADATNETKVLAAASLPKDEATGNSTVEEAKEQ